MIDKNLLKEFLVKRFPLAEAGCVHTYWKVVEEERDAAGKVWVTKIKQPRRAYNPNCDCRPCCQYRRAYVWAIVIQICFRSGGVAADVTHLWPKEDWPRGCQLTPAYVRRIIQSINRADRGERLDGLPRSYGKPGRKKGATAATKFKLP